MAKISNLISVELSDEEKLDAVMPISMPSRPDFPYGLHICFCKDDMDRLGIDEAEARVGATFTFRAMARITCVSSDENESGSHFRMEAQIEAMHIEDGEE